MALFSRCSLTFSSKLIVLVQVLFAWLNGGKAASKDAMVVVDSFRWNPLAL